MRNWFLLVALHSMLSIALAQEQPSSQLVEFDSAGAILSGTVFMPEHTPARAAVVLVHGSGRTDRLSSLARYFATHGIAALTYDKRGVGASGGTYEGENNVSASNLQLLAADAAAALNVLAESARFGGLPLGYAGLSQAGWVVPIAATMAPAPAFVVLWSGPVTTVSEELLFSAEQEDDRAAAARIRAYAAARGADDVDPATSLARLSLPGLWLFGERDDSIPVPDSVSRLDELNAQGHAFEYRIFPGLGHNVAGADDPRVNAAIDWIGGLSAASR